MNFFRLMRKISLDGTGLYKDLSKRIDTLIAFKTGEPMPSKFSGTLRLIFDPELPVQNLPTFFESPAWVARKPFSQFLTHFGVKNIEVFPAVIRNENPFFENNDYDFINITEKLTCLNRKKSTFRALGEDLFLADQITLDSQVIKDLKYDLFIPSEDTDIMIVSETLKKALEKENFPDLFFEPLEIL